MQRRQALPRSGSTLCARECHDLIPKSLPSSVSFYAPSTQMNGVLWQRREGLCLRRCRAGDLATRAPLHSPLDAPLFAQPKMRHRGQPSAYVIN
jgi:hypothetical protein